MRHKRIRRVYQLDTDNEAGFEYKVEENIEVKDDISLLRLVDNHLFLLNRLLNEKNISDESNEQTDLFLRQREIIAAVIEGRKSINNSVISELLKKIHLSFEEFLLFAVLLVETALNDNRFFVPRCCNKIRESDKSDNRIDDLELLYRGDYLNLRGLLSIIGIRNPQNCDAYISRMEEYGLIEKRLFSKLKLGGSEIYIKLSNELLSVFNADPEEEDTNDELINLVKPDTVKENVTKFHILMEDPLIRKILECIRDYKKICSIKNDIEPPKIILYGEDNRLINIVAAFIASELNTGILSYKLCREDNFSLFFNIGGRRKRRWTDISLEKRIFRLAFLGNSVIKLEVNSNSDIKGLIQRLSNDGSSEKILYNFPLLIQKNSDEPVDLFKTDILANNIQIYKLDGVDNKTASAYLNHLLGEYDNSRNIFSENTLIRLNEIELIAKIAKRKAADESVLISYNLLEEAKKIVLCAIEDDKNKIINEDDEDSDFIPIESSIRERLSDVILNSNEELELKGIIFAIQNKEKLYSEIMDNKITYGKGIKILFYGPPGTGKTLSARVVAGETKMPLISVRLNQLFNKYVGDTEKNIRRYFETAEKRNAILFFDECDSLIMSRDNLNRSFEFSFANTFLKEVENFNGVLILATNYENIRDRALNRRIQFFLRFENPDYESRIRLLRKIISEKYQKNIDISSVAKVRFNGGHLKNVWIKAGIKILKGETVDTGFFINSLKEEISKEKVEGDEKKAGF